MLHNLLIYRLACVNVAGMAMLVWAWSAGWVDRAIEADKSRLVFLIAALFVIGTISLFRRAMKVSRRMNAVKAGGVLDDDPDKIMEKAAHLDDVPELLVMVGLIGTLLGIIMSLDGVSKDDFGSISGVQEIAGRMLAGMGVAFYTSLTGMVFSAWATINRRMLRTATVSLVADGRK